MAKNSVPSKKSNSRVFLIQFRAGPTHVPQYMDWAAVGAIEQALGDSTRIEVPSLTSYDKFDVVGEVPGAVENPTVSVMFQDRLAKSAIMELAIQGCPMDIQIHRGKCRDPRDFDIGWEVIDVLEAIRATNYSKDDSGALASTDNDKVTESVDFSGLNLYQIVPMSYSERAKTNVTSEVIAIRVCDTPSCGDCGAASAGCDKVFAVMAPAGSSPGLKPEVVYTDDGYQSSGISTITTLAVGEDPDDAACVGENLVVVSEDSESLHYAPTADILAGTETWAEVTTGFVATHGPNAIDSYSPRDTYIVGQGGYIYFTADPTNGVSAIDEGVATTENLLDVFVFNTQLILACGENNAVVYSENAGGAFQSVTGPAAAVNLLSISARAESEWWITTAAGRVYYSLDKGITWTEKEVPGSGTGSLTEMEWASDSVGFMAQVTAAPAGRILRTINGGQSWYVAPELQAGGTMPTNTGINTLAVCQRQVNVVYGGGKSAVAGDGFIVKGS